MHGAIACFKVNVEGRFDSVFLIKYLSKYEEGKDEISIRQTNILNGNLCFILFLLHFLEKIVIRQ